MEFCACTVMRPRLGRGHRLPGVAVGVCVCVCVCVCVRVCVHGHAHMVSLTVHHHASEVGRMILTLQ